MREIHTPTETACISEDFPPINRTHTEQLGIVQIVLEGAGGKVYTDPNNIAVLSQTNGIEGQVGGPVPGQCTLTGGPAFRYEDNELSLWLNRDAMYRMLRRNLEATEYFALREKFGIFYAIKHYDIDTGLPTQPTWGPEDRETFMAHCMTAVCGVQDLPSYAERAKPGVPLYRHLGMRLDEFQRWEADPGCLFELLFLRMRDYGTID